MSPRQTDRAYLRVPVTIQQGGNKWSGRTRDLSRGGSLVLVESPYPAGTVEAALELPTGVLHSKAEVRFTIPGVGVGLEFLDMPESDQNRLEDLVSAAAATFGAWGLVGKYLAESEQRSPLKLPTPAESGRPVLQRVLTPVVNAELSQHLLHPVGENGAAYRILFARPGTSTPEQSDLATRVTGFVRAVQGKVALVAAQDIWLKLHAGSQPKPFRVVQLTSGGYAAVVVAESPGELPRVSLLTLAVNEQMAVSQRGQSLYPHFSESELEEIRNDSVKGQPPVTAATQGSPAKAAVPEKKAQFSTLAPFDANRESALEQALKNDPQVEVRRYGERTVTLHPYFLIKVKLGEGEEVVGVPMFDGRRYCVLQMSSAGVHRVVPLTRDMQFAVMRR